MFTILGCKGLSKQDHTLDIRKVTDKHDYIKV